MPAAPSIGIWLASNGRYVPIISARLLRAFQQARTAVSGRVAPREAWMMSNRRSARCIEDDHP